MSPYEVQSRYPKFDWDAIEQIDGLVDDLDRETLACTIARELRGEARPRILGVYGWWGSGKSYLLSLVIRRIFADNQTDRKKRIIVCTFNPWRYEMEGSLAPALIKTLSNLEEQFKEHQADFLLKDSEEYKRIAKTLLDLILEIAPIVVPDQPLIAIASKVLTKGIETAQVGSKQQDTEGPICIVDQVRDQMQALVNAILDAAYKADSTKEYRLVVFVDDLDRCSPENMVRMFEWLKVHLRVEGCTYVLALDHVAAARAIVGRYREYLTDEKDLAYGFRYLEKLVDSEYELQLAPKVELMALRQVYGRNTSYKRLSEAARALCGGDFPGIQSMNSALEIRSLLTPRTMLKIVYKFKQALDVILSDAAAEFRSQLPSAYPFWMLFLIAMYYRLDPDELDDFIRGRGSIFELMRKSQVESEDWGTGPKREFCQYAARFGETVGAGMQLPSPQILADLASIIRENTFTK